MGRGISGVTDVVIGRRLCEEWSQYWPSAADDPFASFINQVRKHVFTSTLGDVSACSNSVVVEGDPVGYVTAPAQGRAAT